jgi:glycosyltransferase involved in cell wall biosynthesis
MTPDLASSPGLLFVSTYPPTRCGIASFTQSLVRAIAEIRGEARDNGVIRLRPGWDVEGDSAREVVAEAWVDEPGWAGRIATWCNGFDLLWIQHEFGIFGPDDGLEVLECCSRSPLPIATTLHTVAVAPTLRQKQIIESIGTSSELLVVMSKQAANRLVDVYDVAREKVHVVPHGARPIPSRLSEVDPERRPTVVNWGLIGPSKGLEWGIKAMARLQHLDPPPRLIIRGTTHPNVKRQEGELYREQLATLVRTLGLEECVTIEDGYMPAAELDRLVRGADLDLLPYDNEEQVTSGVLVDAIAAGLPVVATKFPHAVEMLESGAGLVVPQRDDRAMARAIESLLTSPARLTAATEEARRVGQRHAWPRVAASYERLARLVVTADETSVA